MNVRYCFQSHLARRALLLATTFALLAATASDSKAGFVVGTVPSPQDEEAVVVGIIDDYNASNDPDLPTDIELFKKTDDDAAFVFNLVNGFEFFKDEALTMQVFTEAELTSLNMAWFTYSGMENLAYYSVKSGPNVTLWTYMPGGNKIDIPGADNEISHVSFWTIDIEPPDIPEPSTVVLAALGIFGLGLMRFRRRN